MNIIDCAKTRCKNSPLDSHQPSHHHLVVQHFGVPVDLMLTIDELIRNRYRDISLGARVDSKLWASSEPEAVETFNPTE